MRTAAQRGGRPHRLELMAAFTILEIKYRDGEKAMFGGHEKINLSVVLMLLLAFAQVASAVYTEPTRRTVLNEVIELSDEQASFPIYLSDAGDYFTEVYLTDQNGEVDRSHQKPITLELRIDFLRKGKLLRSEKQRVEFAPGEVNKTLFTARAPLDLPQRRNIEVVVAAQNIGATPEPAANNLRLQITRKFEVGPIFLR